MGNHKKLKRNFLFQIAVCLSLLVLAPVAKGQKPTMQIACNLAELEFVDLVKSNPKWHYGNGIVNDDYQFLNWSGNPAGFEPKTMRLTNDGSFYPHHSPIIASNGYKICPQLWFNFTANGTYTVVVEGKGKLSFVYSEPAHFSSTSSEYSFTNGTTFTFTTNGLTNPDNTGYPATTGSGSGGNGSTMIWLQITESDSLNPVKNIKVLPPDYTDAIGTVHHFIDEYQSKPFHPKLIEDMQKYTAIRFMDIGKTNGSKVKYWSQIRKPNELGTKTTPYIDMITLCNQANRDLWLTIPHLASNGFVDTLAQLVKANLKPTLKAYIEYSNEVWNTGFVQTGWASEQGMILGWVDNPGGKYYVRRSSEIFKRFSDIYKNNRNRILFVCAWQMGGGNSTLGDYYNDPLINQDAVKPDLFAVAPYFYKLYQQGDIGIQGECLWQTCDACVATNVPTVQTILDDMLNSVRTDVFNGLKYAKTGSDKYHIPLITYEGGPHAIGLWGAENSCALTDNLMKANRDPKMYDIYREWLDTLSSSGIQMLNLYFDCGGWSKWGAWGLEEFRGQDMASQKFKALVDWKGANPVILDAQAPSAPGTPVKELATSTTITLTWPASTDNGSIIGYDIFRDGEFSGSSNCQVNNTKYTASGLKPNTSYNFYIMARDFGGNYSAQSNSIAISTGAPDIQKPSTIINLELIQKTYNEIRIKWSPSADNDKVEKYIITVGASKDSTQELSYLLKKLSPSTTYKIYVQAQDPSGNISEASYIIVNTNEYPILKAKQTQATITIDGKLDEKSWSLPYMAKKTVSLASTIDDDTISLGVLWDANFLYLGAKAVDEKLIKSAYYWDGDGFEILIDGNNNKSKTFETGFDIKYTFLWNDGTMIGTDTIGVLHKTQNIDGGWTCEIAIPWSKLGITSPAAGLTTGFDIIYDDADYNEWGRNRQYTFVGDESIYTSCEQFTTLTLSSDTKPPVAPANINFSDITMGSANVSWSATSDNAGILGYNVFINNKQINADIVTTTTFTIDGLQPNTQYTVSVCGIDNNYNASEKISALLTTVAGNTIVDFNAGLNTTKTYSLKNTVQHNTSNDIVPFNSAVNTELFGAISEYNKQYEIKGGFNYEHTATPPSSGNMPGIYRKGSGDQTDGSLYIFTGETTQSSFTGILMWSKDKFLNGNDAFSNIAFDSTADSRLFLKIKSNQNSTIRFVIKASNNYYISEAVFYSQNDASGINTFAINEFGKNGEVNKRWALYDPTTLKMPVENSINFAATDLSDVQEIGLIFSVGRPQWAYSFGLVEFSAYGIKKVSDTQAPSKPAGLNATDTTSSSFVLNWDASTDNINVTAYNIFEHNSMGNDILIGTTSSIYYAIGGLAENSSFSYRVQARDRTGNKSDLSDIFTFNTGTNTNRNETSTNQIQLFPNPATESLFVEGAPVNSKILVYTINGKLQLQAVILDSQQIIDVKNLPSGMYIVKINDAKTSFIGRFVKK